MHREAVLAAMVALSPGSAWAAGCTITGNAPTVTATAIDFNLYSASATSPKQANGTVQIRCPLGIGLLPSFTVALSAGNGNAGSFSPRRMSMGASRLDYNIFTTSGYGTVWGDGTGGTATQSFSAILSLGTISFTSFGQVPTGQYVATGTYNDTVTVTVTY